MTTLEVANKLVELCRKGDFEGAMTQLYSPDIVSVEGAEMPGMPRIIKGIEAVGKKGEWWYTNHTIHEAKTSDAYVSVDKFAVVFDFDVTFKPTGKRSKMVEVAVYTVADGKIIHEEFLYHV